MMAGASALARYAYNSWVGYDVRWEKGEGYQPKSRYTLPREGFCHIGEQGVDPNGSFLHDSLLEKEWLSRGSNYIPGVNSTAGLHDVMQVKLDEFFGSLLGEATGGTMRSLMNVPNMIPAAIISTGGLLADPRAIMFYTFDSTKDR